VVPVSWAAPPHPGAKSSSSASYWKSPGQDQASPPVGRVPPAARFMPTPWSVVGNPTHEADEELVGVFELPQEEEDAGAAKAKQLRMQQAARGFDSWRHLPNEIKVRSSRLAFSYCCISGNVFYIFLFLGPQVAVLSWLPLRDVGACASVSHDMHALTKVPAPPTTHLHGENMVLQPLLRPPGTIAVEHAGSSPVGRLRGSALARHRQSWYTAPFSLCPRLQLMTLPSFGVTRFGGRVERHQRQASALQAQVLVFTDLFTRRSTHMT
jgi:hypothetical protein